MPTQENITLIKNTIRTSNATVKNEYFEQVLSMIVYNEGYSLEQLFSAANRQIDIANEVIETGQPFSGRTTEGNVIINLENANQILLEGLWLYIAIIAFADYSQNDRIFNLVQDMPGLTETVTNFESALTLNNIDAARRQNINALEQNPEVELEDIEDLEDTEDLEDIEDSEDMYEDMYEDEVPADSDVFSSNYIQRKADFEDIFTFAYDLLKKDETYLMEYLDKNYQILAIKNTFKNAFTQLISERTDFETLFSFFNKYKIKENPIIFCKTLSLMHAFLNLADSEKEIVIRDKNKKALVVFDLWDGEPYLTAMRSRIFADMLSFYLFVAILYFKAENRLSEFFKNTDMQNETQLANSIYENTVLKIAEYVTLPQHAGKRNYIPLYRELSDKLAENIIDKTNEIKIKEEFKSSENIFQSFMPINFKGW
jgi:hypothetical protein